MRAFRSMPVAALLLMTSLAAGAYESDFHYGLTWWLARQAGFDALQSHHIARGNELTDTGMLDAKHAIVWRLCLAGDENASRLTRELHFRAQKSPPADPEERIVDSGQAFASLEVKNLIREEGTEEVDRLVRFGKALHGWQDAFSHKGVPDTPGRCAPDWVWAHPEKRGGAYRHQADQTFIYPSDCLDAARTSYDLLLAYRRARAMPGSAPDWSRLFDRVIAFCQANTRTAKAEWLHKQQVLQADAVARNTSLRNGDNPPSRGRIDLGEKLPNATAAAAEVPFYEQQAMAWQADAQTRALLQPLLQSLPSIEASAQAQAWAADFSQAWLTTPAEKLADALAPFFAEEVLKARPRHLHTLLRLRLEDPGMAVDDLKDLEAGQLVTAKPDDWRSLLVPVRGRDAPFLVGHREGDGQRIALISILRSAPNDVLLIDARHDGETYRIQSLGVLVFH
ncbi:hypothetical protein [Pseudomonas sp. Q1-7]|uniref:hypothetical protein n=1 Tax=Pseudomonas sp. Q1-7 TaxID=3020843 RepID=UPI0022FFE03D|nr:hypothetical protein [Pseudomonas sp. Q1-7]